MMLELQSMTRARRDEVTIGGRWRRKGGRSDGGILEGDVSGGSEACGGSGCGLEDRSVCSAAGEHRVHRSSYACRLFWWIRDLSRNEWMFRLVPED